MKGAYQAFARHAQRVFPGARPAYGDGSFPFEELGGGDVQGVPVIYSHVRAHGRTSHRRALADAVKRTKDGRIPVAFCKNKGEPWVAVLRPEDLLSLIVEVERARGMQVGPHIEDDEAPATDRCPGVPC